jgi:hypothetical protein
VASSAFREYSRQQWENAGRYAWILFAVFGVVVLVINIGEYRDIKHLRARAVPISVVVQSSTGGVHVGDLVVRGVESPQTVCTAHYEKGRPPAVGDVITVLYDMDAPERCRWSEMPKDQSWTYPLGASAFYWILAFIGGITAFVLRRQRRAKMRSATTIQPGRRSPS